MRQGAPVDAGGAPLPWYTYPAIEYLSQFDLLQRAIFEFGGGHSSRFWAARAALVVTVENDPAWFERLRRQLRPNQRVLLRTQREGYLAALAEQPGRFDVIAIDGAWRHACARAALDKLHDHGIIVLDNSDKFPAAAEFLRTRGFFQVDFNGLGPVNNYAWTTSVFVRAANPMQQNYRPPSPVGGLGVRLGVEDEEDGSGADMLPGRPHCG